MPFAQVFRSLCQPLKRPGKIMGEHQRQDQNQDKKNDQNVKKTKQQFMDRCQKAAVWHFHEQRPGMLLVVSKGGQIHESR